MRPLRFIGEPVQVEFDQPPRFDKRPDGLGGSDTSMKPLRFIGEPVQVDFDRPPRFEKRPDCPDRFLWQEETYRIVAILSEWHDYSRRGRMASNMRPSHAATASLRGSWGVGRYYFRVRVERDRVFDLYYDRAPQGASGRKGSWFLLREMTTAGEE